MMNKLTKRKNADDFATYNPAEAVAINPANMGSDFNDFLAEEDLLEEIQATSLKRVIAHLLQKDMSDKGLTKQVMAKREDIP